MVIRVRLLLCFILVFSFYSRISFAGEFEELSVKEIGENVLFGCNSGDDCGINEERTMSNFKKACMRKNLRIKDESEYLKECTGNAYKGMKELYSFYF